MNQKYPVAISDSDGAMDFYISSNHEASSLLKNFQTDYSISKKITVQGLTYHSLIKQCGLENNAIDLIKVDIEGSELELIENLSTDDAKLINQITIEFHDWINPGLTGRTIKAIEKLKSLGFTGFSTSKDHTECIEILFVNNIKDNFSIRQKLILNIYNIFKYMP